MRRKHKLKVHSFTPRPLYQQGYPKKSRPGWAPQAVRALTSAEVHVRFLGHAARTLNRRTVWPIPTPNVSRRISCYWDTISRFHFQVVSAVCLPGCVCISARGVLGSLSPPVFMEAEDFDEIWYKKSFYENSNNDGENNIKISDTSRVNPHAFLQSCPASLLMINPGGKDFEQRL